MNINITPYLLDRLASSGLAESDLGRVDMGAFGRIYDQYSSMDCFSHWNDEQRQAAAVVTVLTHPVFTGVRRRRSRVLAETQAPVAEPVVAQEADPVLPAPVNKMEWIRWAILVVLIVLDMLSK